MKHRILVVDDSSLVREMCKTQLEDAGYEVITAVDGITAINETFFNMPDLILLDVQMPKINGYQVCRLLKDHPSTRNIPIIIMTAKEARGFVQDPKKWSFQTGADGYFGKDEGGELLPLVASYLKNVPVVERKSENSVKAMDETEVMLALSHLLDRQLYVDITRLKDLDEMKDAFVANVAHEFGTPIAVLKGFIENMKDGLNGPVTAHQINSLELMLKTVMRVGRLVRDMLDISKIEAGKMELERDSMDLVKIVKGVADTFELEAEKKEIHLQRALPREPVLFTGDEDRITQVFVNLISNAIKYTPPKENVYVRLIDQEEKKMIRIEIEDTGPGIKEDKREKIFDKFIRIREEKQEGTGLGLPIARDLVVLHGGKIWVEPGAAKGSRFVIMLPRK